VRFLESKLWVELKPDDEISTDSKVDLISDVCNRSGKKASYWKVDYVDQTSLSRVIAAYASARKDLGGCVLGIVEVSSVEALGIATKQTAGAADIADKSIRDTAHFDLDVDTVAKAIQMANLLRTNTSVFNSRHVRGCFKHSIEQNFFAVSNLSKSVAESYAKQGFFTVNPSIVSSA